jgi:FtsH-binding integral membrane protein
MTKSKVIALGLLLTLTHFGVYFVLPENWQNANVFWFTPMLFLFSVGLITVAKKVNKSEQDKTAIYFAYLSVFKLLLIAIALLVLGMNIPKGNRLPLIFHCMIPALLFIALETLFVWNILMVDENSNKS